MDNISVDARGLACPEPVISVKKALTNIGTPLLILVDNKAAAENITRFTSNKGYTVSIKESSGEFYITVDK